jgi:hypothetical protein
MFMLSARGGLIRLALAYAGQNLENEVRTGYYSIDHFYPVRGRQNPISHSLDI